MLVRVCVFFPVVFWYEPCLHKAGGLCYHRWQPGYSDCLFGPPCKVNRYPFLSPPSQKHYTPKDSFGPACTWKPTCTTNQTKLSLWGNFLSVLLHLGWLSLSILLLLPQFEFLSWRINTWFLFDSALFHSILSPFHSFNGKVPAVLEGRNLKSSVNTGVTYIRLKLKATTPVSGDDARFHEPKDDRQPPEDRLVGSTSDLQLVASQWGLNPPCEYVTNKRHFVIDFNTHRQPLWLTKMEKYFLGLRSTQ